MLSVRCWLVRYRRVAEIVFASGKQLHPAANWRKENDMRISRFYPAVCAAVFCAAFAVRTRRDNPAQAAARAAMEEQMRAMDMQQASTNSQSSSSVPAAPAQPAPPAAATAPSTPPPTENSPAPASTQTPATAAAPPAATPAPATPSQPVQPDAAPPVSAAPPTAVAVTPSGATAQEPTIRLRQRPCRRHRHPRPLPGQRLQVQGAVFLPRCHRRQAV